MSTSTLPIWHASVSLPAKLTYMAHRAGLPLNDDSLSDALFKLRQAPKVSLDECVQELEASGWL